MADKLRVLGLCGSLREASYNRVALAAAVELAPDDMEITTWDELGAVPPYDEDVRESGLPPVVERLRDAIRESDGVLIATPEYNYSIPGVLKNAVDWASRPPEQPFRAKPVALMSASPGALGGARAQYHLRQCFVFLDGRVMNLPEVFMSGVADKVKEGRLVHDPTRSFLADQFLPAFADWIRHHRA